MIARVIVWFTGHWQVKLVALFLAIALWFYTSGQANVERMLTVNIPKATVHLPPDYEVTTIEPAGFQLAVEGPVAVLRGLRSELVLDLVVSADALPAGRQSFPITQRMLGVSNEVRLKNLPERGEVTVVFSPIVEDSLPVESPRVVNLPNGFEAAVTLSRHRVHVRGPKSVIDALRTASGERQHLRFHDIVLDLAAPSGDRFTLKQALLPDLPSQVSLLETVEAEVSLTRTMIPGRITVNLPIHVLASKDFLRKFEVDLSEASIAITIRGPMVQLDQLEPDRDLTAYIDLRRPFEPFQQQDVVVQVLAPTWLDHDQMTVKVRVKPLAQASGNIEPQP